MRIHRVNLSTSSSTVSQHALARKASAVPAAHRTKRQAFGQGWSQRTGQGRARGLASEACLATTIAIATFQRIPRGSVGSLETLRYMNVVGPYLTISILFSVGTERCFCNLSCIYRMKLYLVVVSAIKGEGQRSISTRQDSHNNRSLC